MFKHIISKYHHKCNILFLFPNLAPVEVCVAAGSKVHTGRPLVHPFAFYCCFSCTRSCWSLSQPSLWTGHFCRRFDLWKRWAVAQVKQHKQVTNVFVETWVRSENSDWGEKVFLWIPFRSRALVNIGLSDTFQGDQSIAKPICSGSKLLARWRQWEVLWASKSSEVHQKNYEAIHQICSSKGCDKRSNSRECPICVCASPRLHSLEVETKVAGILKEEKKRKKRR